MMASHRPFYSYKPLPSKSSFRLLQVSLGSENIQDDTITCLLKVLDQEDKPSFDALSYTWGDPLYHGFPTSKPINRMTDEPCIPIICDGQVLHITENLSNALSQLRSTLRELAGTDDTWRHSGFIWVDAVCIDQSNLSERGSQVAMMGQIYRAARTVIVWLGPHDEHTDQAVYVGRQLSSIPVDKYKAVASYSLDDPQSYQILGIPKIEKDQWLAFAALMQRSWFTRAWILQEAVVARELMVICGNTEILWSGLVASSVFLRESQWYLPLTVLATEAAGLEDLSRTSLPSIQIIGTNPQIISELKRNLQSLSFEQLLATSRFLKAKDPRDHVYALLEIRDEPLASEKSVDAIFPDYSISVEEVYSRAAWAVLQSTMDLNHLSNVEDISCRSIKDLSSWVPDYSVSSTPIPLQGNPRGHQIRWRAAGNFTWKLPTQVNTLLLKVEGFPFDTVIETASTGREIGRFHQLIRVLNLVLHISQPCYPDGGCNIEALWRTLIADMFCAQPAPKEAGIAFRSFIIHCLSALEDAVKDPNNSTLLSNVESPKEPEDMESGQLVELLSQTRTALSKLAAIDESGVVPSLDMVTAAIKIIKGLQTAEKQELHASWTNFAGSLSQSYGTRRLFRTKGGYLGIAAQSLREGDLVWILAGAAVPMVLREKESGNYQLIGEAYVHGIMQGEACSAEGVKFQPINLE